MEEMSLIISEIVFVDHRKNKDPRALFRKTSDAATK